MATKLPARPRLRASFWFESGALQGELTMMDERRNLVHRQRYAMNDGDVMVKIHQALATIAAQSALNAGAAVLAEPAPSSTAPSSERSTTPPPGRPVPSDNVPRAAKTPVAPAAAPAAASRPASSNVVPRAPKPASAPQQARPVPSNVVPRKAKTRDVVPRAKK